MQEVITSLLAAVIMAAVPVLTTYAVDFIKKAAANKAAETENIVVQRHIKEIATAIEKAVSCTSQTYVDALKKAGNFTKEAQAEAARKSFEACKMSLSISAQEYIEHTYGDVDSYLKMLIEAEVRQQKNEKTE